MRIWCQSCSSIGTGSSHELRYQAALEKRAKEVARPDTIIEFHGIDDYVPEMDRCIASFNIGAWQTIRNAFRAEQQGYDAFAVTNTPSPGFLELKQTINIPLVYITESAISIALMLAPKFAFFVHNEPLMLQVQELPKRWGLAERMVQGGYVGIEDREIITKYLGSTGSPIIDRIKKAASEVVERGADILLPASNVFNMLLLDQNIQEIEGARILDIFGCLIKTTELMVDMKKIGITTSRHGLYAAPPIEALAEIKKMYEN
jgi:allantoin racemase